MKSFLLGLALSVTLVLGGCGTTSALQKVQTIAQVAFLAENYKDMKLSIKSLPMIGAEAEARARAISQFESIRADLAALAKGDIESDKLVDYATGKSYVDRVATAYNVLMQEAMAPFVARTRFQVPPKFWQYNTLGVNSYRSLLKILETDGGLEVKSLVALLKLSAVTIIELKTGKIPSAILGTPI